MRFAMRARSLCRLVATSPRWSAQPSSRSSRQKHSQLHDAVGLVRRACLNPADIVCFQDRRTQAVLRILTGEPLDARARRIEAAPFKPTGST